jgi:hypothetical protein
LRYGAGFVWRDGALKRRAGVDVVGFGVVHGSTLAASLIASPNVIEPRSKPA